MTAEFFLIKQQLTFNNLNIVIVLSCYCYWFVLYGLLDFPVKND